MDCTTVKTPFYTNKILYITLFLSHILRCFDKYPLLYKYHVMTRVTCLHVSVLLRF